MLRVPTNWFNGIVGYVFPEIHNNNIEIIYFFKVKLYLFIFSEYRYDVKRWHSLKQNTC